MANRVVIVGAGLSGLAAGYRLKLAGYEVTVLERAPTVGGCAASRRERGYVVDTGCDLVNSTFVRYLQLVDELGLRDRVVPCSRVVDFVRAGGAVSFDPKRPHEFLFSPLLTPRSKLVAVAGFARLLPTLRRFDAYSMTDYDDSAYGTGPEFIARYFNSEIGARVIDPLVRAFTGTGLEHATGLAVLATLAVGAAPAVAVQGGMAVVPEALAARMDVRCEAEAVAVDDDGEGVTVRYRDRDGEHELVADACVLATSFGVAAGIWPTLARATPGLASRLRDLALISVSVGYDCESPTAAYGVMVPTRENSEALLIFMEQNKAPDRAPAGKTLATIFTDGSVTSAFMDHTDDELADWAGGILESIYPELRGRREMSIATRWGHTGYMPFPGFLDLVVETKQKLAGRAVQTTSALFGSGGVEHAVVGGERAAERTVAVLERRPLRA
jgi:protoporphyrinogen/coproporphyrinogen III oxidase